LGLRLAWVFWGVGVGVHDGLHQEVMEMEDNVGDILRQL
jgi:hypothetical protein